MGIPRFAVSSVATWLALAAVCAQAPATAQDVEPLDEVVVSGEYPGPGLWKVTRADDAAGHVMWIVGEPPPLPKRMKWKSKDIEAVALSAQEILLDSAVRMDTDEKIGFFTGLTLLPAILEARRNPDDAKLKDLLPARPVRTLARAEEALPGSRKRRRKLAPAVCGGQAAQGGIQGSQVARGRRRSGKSSANWRRSTRSR